MPNRYPSAPQRHAMPGARDVLAQLIQPTLHPQRWSLEGAQSGGMYRAIHLSAGRARLDHTEGQLQLRAPDVAWLPTGSARSLHVEAGSTGVIVGVSDPLVAAAIGDQADSRALRQISARLCSFTDFETTYRDELVRALLAIEAEAQSGVGGSWHYLSAHLTIVLVMLWRMAGRSAPQAPAHDPHAERLQRFRHLVEAQFRQHWPVAQYAAELGLSADRLHDLCVRHVDRAPITLIHQRLVREGCLLLSGSDLSIERLSADLGFASASHFSRFFKRWLGTGPKAWRQQSRSLAVAGMPSEPTSYADWP